MFDKQTNEAYEVWQEAMKPYFSVYTAAFEKVVEIHQEATA